jgi:hypothetical protein
MKEVELSVKLNMQQFCQSIDKANELIDTVNKAKTLIKDLTYMMEQVNFKPTVVDEPPADEQSEVGF